MIGASAFPVTLLQEAQDEIDIPSYAKWGKLTMQETKARYPHADIIDYLHKGSESNQDKTIEKFKL
jgi:hypothetical protein